MAGSYQPAYQVENGSHGRPYVQCAGWLTTLDLGFHEHPSTLLRFRQAARVRAVGASAPRTVSAIFKLRLE